MLYARLPQRGRKRRYCLGWKMGPFHEALCERCKTIVEHRIKPGLLKSNMRTFRGSALSDMTSPPRQELYSRDGRALCGI